MAILDSQPVNQTASNAAWVSATQDDTKVGVLTLNAGPVSSGVPVTDTQKEHNAIATFVGKALNSVWNSLPTWTANEGFAGADDSVVERVEQISEKFDKDTGHTHDGTDGEGGVISAASISGLATFVGGAIMQIDGSEASPEVVEAAVGVLFSSSSAITVKYIVGDSTPTTVTADPPIAAGVEGQILILIGTDSTDYVLLDDGTSLHANGPNEIGDQQVLGLIMKNAAWQKLFSSY